MFAFGRGYIACLPTSPPPTSGHFAVCIYDGICGGTFEFVSSFVRYQPRQLRTAARVGLSVTGERVFSP